MNVSLELDIPKDLDKIDTKQLPSLLTKLEILQENDLVLLNDIEGIWQLLDKLKSRRWEGFRITVKVTDAFNDYGQLDRWSCKYLIYQERCRHCGNGSPGCMGNHSWKKEWVSIASDSGFTVKEAVLRTLIRWHFKKPKELPLYHYGRDLKYND